MKVSSVVAAGAAFAGFATAQSSAKASSPTTTAAMANVACLQLALNSIPACGLSVLTSIGSSAFGCGLTDLDCQCRNYGAISARAFSPVLAGCGATTALDVQTAAQRLCNCVTYGTSAGAVPASADPLQTTAGVNPNANKLCVGYGLAIPACGTAVLQSLAGQIGGCQDTDFECQCGHIDSVQAVASTPVINACGTTTALLVQSAAAQLCSCISANNFMPTKVGNASVANPTSAASHGAAPQARYPSGSWLSIFAGILAFL